MTSEKNEKQLQNSSLSNQMVESLQYDEILVLGKKITEELNLNDSVDTLGRWMAHYIAELICSIEKIDSEDDKQRLKRECADIILKLWRHIGYIPEGLEPFKRYENLLSKLERVTSSNFFERVMLPSPDEIDSVTEKEQKWISIVSVLSETFNRLVNFCVESAIKEIDKPKINWSELSTNSLPYGQSVIQIEKLLGSFCSYDETEEDVAQKRKSELLDDIDNTQKVLEQLKKLI